MLVMKQYGHSIIKIVVLKQVTKFKEENKNNVTNSLMWPENKLSFLYRKQNKNPNNQLEPEQTIHMRIWY